MSTLQEIKRKPLKSSGEIPDSAYFIPIPLNFIKGFGWKKGDTFEWTISGKDKLILKRINQKVVTP